MEPTLALIAAVTRLDRRQASESAIHLRRVRAFCGLTARALLQTVQSGSGTAALSAAGASCSQSRHGSQFHMRAARLKSGAGTTQKGPPTSMPPIPENIPVSPPTVERLTYTKAETRKALGVKSTTLWRLEKRVLLMPIPGRHYKLYSIVAVRRFVEGQA